MSLSISLCVVCLCIGITQAPANAGRLWGTRPIAANVGCSLPAQQWRHGWRYICDAGEKVRSAISPAACLPLPVFTAFHWTVHRKNSTSGQCRSVLSFFSSPCVACRVVRIELFHFLARCHKRLLNQSRSVFLFFIDFQCVAVYYGYFLCIVSWCWYVFFLLVVVVKLSVLAKWLVRKIPLQNPTRGEGIVSTMPNCVYNFLGFIVLWCVCLVSAIRDIYRILMARYSLLKHQSAN